MRDDHGVVQLWTVSPNGGDSLCQITHDPWDVASAFTWNPEGASIAYIADGSVFTVDVATGQSHRLTAPTLDPADTLLALACVFSPDGRRIAYLRPVADVPTGALRHNQIFVVSLPR
jgi:Tol biopolymer transport system component